MKKFTIVLFAAAGILIVFFAVKKQWFVAHTKDTVRTQTVIPSVPGAAPIFSQEDNPSADEINLTSLIPLQAGEILIAAYSVDFDIDGYDDQIIAVKTPENKFIKVIVGLYNPRYSRYERSAEIVTDMEQVKTFSLSVMDITGTHENALIITGYGIKNESRFQAWLPRRSLQNFYLHEIANLYAEGTIFVQQRPRSDSYSLDNTDGESFPVWAYTSDTSGQEGSLDQLQIMYDWSKEEKKYIEKVRTTIPQKNITAQELGKIQDGTEKTFASFLDGLWIKNSHTADNNRYLFFNYEKKEIIFFQTDRQEIYTWERSTLRRNGILVYTTNQSMSNISRRFDIALVSTDEIRIKVVDDLGMVISSETLWDGNYKKQNREILFGSPPPKSKADDIDILHLLQTTSRTFWKCDNGWEITFSDNQYTAKNGSVLEHGAFSKLTVFDESLLQFRSREKNGIFSGFYRSEIIYAEKSETKSEKTPPGTQVILHPVIVSISQIEPAVSRSLQLELENIRD
ncbi:pallilysin-related adhesin [Treponema sp. OMZ 840]|uniref:pallilysin-related adhesin n=1 Tax=Treponema sp. OMZ 840 TaxID=244313 RepID=UPI003D936721